MRTRTLAVYLLIPILSACVAVDQHPSDNKKSSDINVQLGIGYLQQNKLELANEKLTKALRQNPESAPAHNAYAMLQDRLLVKDKAAWHYEKATSLDPKNSQAANNYGAFLCRNDQQAKSEIYFLRALKNPLYKTPEYAYTNAALCLIKIGQIEKPLEYLTKALAADPDFPTALITMAKLSFEQQDFVNASSYVKRYHFAARPDSRSLWLSIRIALELGRNSDVAGLAHRLGSEFPDSDEYKFWLAIQ